MLDADIRVPAEAKAALTALAAAEGLSLRAYLIRLAGTAGTAGMPPASAERACVALHAWNGYAPTTAEQRALDRELDRRLAAHEAQGSARAG
ncbi:hypothetical protein ACFVYT_01220 [Streptomyces sp. NPDC058290]|uniref:hypothetical protein n=1 Tax=Streptomyces sp. NPDC058290 TaxID=3346426 RepID=UPI0036F0AC03